MATTLLAVSTLLDLRKFKANPGLHSSGTTRESCIVRSCLKTQTKTKKKREESLWTFLPFVFEITWFSWMLTQRCSFFVVIILFDFFYTEVTILELEHVHIFNLAPFIGVHKALVCKYHHALRLTASELGNMCGQRETSWGYVQRLAGHRYTVLLLLLLWTWPHDSPPALYPSLWCTGSCEPCGDLWNTSWLHRHNHTMHQRVITQLSTMFYTLLLNYVYNVWLKVSILIFFEYRMF